MKEPKGEIKPVQANIWCEYCCIRIAPQEERTAVRDKIYHPRCYSKVTSAAHKAKAGPGGVV